MPIAHEIVLDQRSRATDRWGSGQFGASRAGGRRPHNGVDIIATPNERVMSPIEGEVVREAFPYADDKSYRGVVIRGTGDWEGFEVKLFYVEGMFSGPVREGQIIGIAQDLTQRYPGITNHVHVEVRHLGQLLSPAELWQMSF